MESLEDESADIDTLVHHINSDPAIVARLLAAANSSANTEWLNSLKFSQPRTKRPLPAP